METFLPLLGGLILLVAGGELLVRGSVGVAERFGVSPLLIGLTLVGFGTSTPELITSVQAAIVGSPGIAVGNIVGSNIANILLILGLSALIKPVAIETKALQRDGTLVVMTSLMMAAIGYFAALSRPIGVLMIVLLLAYIFYAWRHERVAPEEGPTAALEKGEAYKELHAPSRAPTGSILVPLLMALAGLALVVLGGRFLVGGAVVLARDLGISETVIGLTIVAMGTSMPEFVTSIVAAIRGHSAVAVGNILGSNIYNILFIGGVTAIISPTIVPAEIVRFDNLVMVATSIILFVFARSGMRIGRREGAALVAGYAAYVFALWPK